VDIEVVQCDQEGEEGYDECGVKNEFVHWRLLFLFDWHIYVHAKNALKNETSR